jgi:ferritin-like metal-binding protein YciE
MNTPNETGREVFVAGLRNAHALENQAVSLIKRQLDRIENYPEVASRLEQHLQETNSQIQRLDDILGRLDESNSTLKDAGGTLMGNMAALGHMFAPDEILKNSFANFAFENYEIAAYKSLCHLAELTGHSAVVPLLEQTLLEEVNMAKWLDDHLKDVTSTYLVRSKGDVTAGV